MLAALAREREPNGNGVSSFAEKPGLDAPADAAGINERVVQS
jgi:hypothetical protein